MNRGDSEPTIERSEHPFDGLAETALDVMFAFGPDGSFTALNPAFESVTGWPRETWLGRSFLSIVHPDDVPRALALLEYAVAGGSLPRFELRLARASGDYLTAEFTCSPQVRDGEVVEILGVARDVSHRAGIEQQLREAEAKYRTLVEQSPGITYIDSMDGPGVTLYISPQVEEVLGYSPEEWLRQPDLWEELLHPDDRDREVRASLRHHETGQPYRGEYRLRTRDGQIRWIRDQATVIPGAGGARGLCHGVLYDITPERMAQEELSRRGAILEAVAFAAGRFVAAPSWEHAIDDVLERLGRSAGASRTYVFQNHWVGGTLCTDQRYEWVADGVRSLAGDPDLNHIGLAERGFQRWIAILWRGDAVRGPVRGFPERERTMLEGHDIRSVLVVPILAGQEWWGFIGFDDCANEREWTGAEVDALKAAAAIVGATIQRDVSESGVRQAEERYRRLVELSPDAIAIHRQGVIVFANTQAARLVRAASPRELVGRQVVSFVHPDSRPSLLGPLEGMEAGGAVPPVEGRFVRLDGTPVEVEVTAAPFTHEGEPALQVVVRDITERKGAEAELRSQNAYLKALHETTLGLIGRLRLDELLETIVLRAAALLGTEHGYISVVRPDHDDISVQVATGLFRDWVGFSMRRGEGMAGTVWDTGEPILVDDYDAWPGHSPAFPPGLVRAVMGAPLTSGPDVVGVIGLAHIDQGPQFTRKELDLLDRFAGLASIALDNARLHESSQRELAERKRTEEALRESERRFREMLENVQLLAVGIDLGGRVTFCNDFLLDLTGWRREDVVGSEWFGRFVPLDQSYSDGVRRGVIPAHVEGEMLTRDGGRRLIAWSNTLLRDPHGAVIGTSSIGEDITERRHAEQVTGEALLQERMATERLRAVDEMKTTFLHAVSHELRTPLSAVLGLALTLNREDVSLSAEDSRELLGRLAVNARKLERLLSDLLDLDRLDRGIVEPRRRPTDLAALIQRIVAGSEMLGARTVAVDAEPGMVRLDAPKVERIVENLLANAARHTPADANVWISSGSSDGGVLIKVEDDGPGVPDAIRRSIFEPFSQGPGMARHSPGVGIGLSLVARFAELHGGRAWVEDRPGGGASFRVYLAT